MIKIKNVFKLGKSSILFAICYLLIAVYTSNADAESPVSIFSTSSDWEKITGRRFSLYPVKFSGSLDIINDGLEMYYLDVFPCYGQPDRVEIWRNAAGEQNRNMLITCLYVPEKIIFGWRNAERNAVQGKTVGMLECPNKSKTGVAINLDECVVGKEWKDF